MKGYHSCLDVTALLLMSLQFRIIFGAYNANKHKPSFFQGNSILSPVVPNFFLERGYSAKYLQRKILKIVSNFEFATETQAELELLTVASKRVTTFGMSFFKVKSQQNEKQKIIGIFESDFAFLSEEFKIESITSFEMITRFEVKKANHFLIETKKESIEIEVEENTFLEFFFGHVKMYFQQVSKAVPFRSDLGPELQDLQDYRLFGPPIKRELLDPFQSRLSLFRHFLIWKTRSLKELIWIHFLDDVEEHIQNMTTMKQIVLKTSTEPETLLEAIKKSIEKTFEYAPSGQFVEDFQIEGIRLVPKVPISNCSAYLTEFSDFLKSTSKYLKLKDIRLGNLKIDHTVDNTLALALKETSSLVSFKIFRCHMSSKSAKLILFCISHSPNLQAVSFFDTGFDHIALGKLLSKGHLKKISLGNIPLSNHSLAPIFQNNSNSIESLSLSNVGFSSKKSGFDFWVEVNTQLKKIKLNQCKIDRSACESISQIISSPKSELKKLILTNSKISKSGAEKVFF